MGTRGELLHGIQLVPLEPELFCLYLEQFSDHVQQALHVTEKASEYQYLIDAHERHTAGKTVFYCVMVGSSLAGAIEIRMHDTGAGQLYSWLNEQYWSTGVYQSALHCATQRFFEESSQLFFNAYVDVGNKQSYYALKKAGFADIGFVNGPRGRQYELIIRKNYCL